MGKDTLKETAAQTVLIADPKGVLCEECAQATLAAALSRARDRKSVV